MNITAARDPPVNGNEVLSLIPIHSFPGGRPAPSNLALAEARRTQKTELIELLTRAGAKDPTAVDANQSPERLKLVSGVYRNSAGESVTLVPGVRGDELLLVVPLELENITHAASWASVRR